jgi:hypothetical protein
MDSNFRYNQKDSLKNIQYRSLANYPYPEPKDTYRLNPLCLQSLKNLDIDDLQDVFGKNIQQQRSYENGQRLQKEIIINDSDEIKELKDAIEHAKLNKVLSRQMNQNLILRKQKLIKEAEEEELVLKEIEDQKKKDEIEKEKKKIEFLKNREINLQQIREKKLQQEEAEKEYERDKKLVDDIVNKMIEEDIAVKKEDQRKKEINKLYMQNAYKERDIIKQKEAEKEKLQEEAIQKYHESVALREKHVAQKKNDLQKQKDKIFNKLCEEEAKRKAEQDYWDTVRSELHMEQDYKKTKLKEKEEEEKRQKMKDDVINSALKQMQFKEMKKKEEEANDAAFREKLLEKYAQDEKLEKEKQEKQRQQLIDIQNAIKKQKEEKYYQYQKQREKELNEYNKYKQEQDAKKYIIEQEKIRLLKENEELLKKYYPIGYYKAKDSLKNIQKPSTTTRHDVIYNNIFGNTNPNKSTSYPQYGKIKNYVYDINVQEVNPNINKINYPMYNATANNNYDSYPTPEEYKKMMEKNGQKNYAYAGGEYVEGVPFRSQRPVFLGSSGNKINNIKNSLKPLNDIGVSNIGMNTIGMKKPNTANYYKTEGNYVNNRNNQEISKNQNYYMERVPEAI